MTSTTATGDLPSNWGRWGLDDQRGTLNHIDAQAQARGARTVSTGRAISLAIPITPVLLAGGGPVSSALVMMPTPVQQIMNYNPHPPAYVDILIINSHNIALTHIDAPVHCPVDDMVYPGIPREQAVSQGRAHIATTSAFADGICTRGVLLDLAPNGRLAPGYSVTGEDFDRAEQRAGLRVESGDALVVRAGWTVHKDFAEPLPAMTTDAIRWMAEREISVYAGDIGDRPPLVPGDVLPLHYVALARLGLPLIDGAQVTELAQHCEELKRWEFLLTVGAMPILGATGVPVNPLAIF